MQSPKLARSPRTQNSTDRYEGICMAVHTNMSCLIYKLINYFVKNEMFVAIDLFLNYSESEKVMLPTQTYFTIDTIRTAFYQTIMILDGVSGSNNDMFTLFSR